MNAEVLRNCGVACEYTTPCKLFGYQLKIRPRVNLEIAPNDIVYGAVAEITHDDIKLLYGSLASEYGVQYSPFSVLTHGEDGIKRTAICYMSNNIEDDDPDPNYIDELVECAQTLGAPQQYVNHIRSFTPRE